MERLEHSTAEWHAYVAGFFDGEGSVSIVRVQAGGKSDYHKIIVTLTQATKYRSVLDRIHAEFGGQVINHHNLTRVSRSWTEMTRWQLQKRSDIGTFLRTIQPFAIVKAEQIALGLEFLTSSNPKRGPRYVRRAANGRILGRIVDAADIDNREALRLRMRALNLHAAPQVAPSKLPPL